MKYVQDKEVMTEPPIKKSFSGLVNQWVIYEAYQEDFEMQVSQLHNYYIYFRTCFYLKFFFYSKGKIKRKNDEKVRSFTIGEKKKAYKPSCRTKSNRNI